MFKTKKSRKKNKKSFPYRFKYFSGRYKVGLVAFVLAFITIGGLLLYKSFAATPIQQVINDQNARVNQLRASRGIGQLAISGCVQSRAQEWANRNADVGISEHRTHLTDYAYDGNWRKLGENVGHTRNYGSDYIAGSVSIFNLLVNSPLHLANMVDPQFNVMGIGAAESANGQLYIVQVFANCGACSGAWNVLSSKNAGPSGGRLDAFARGINGSLWHKWYDGYYWRGWEDLGGSLTSGPGVASRGPGNLDIFVRGSGNRIYHKWYDGKWREWEDLGGSISSDPGAIGFDNGQVHIFARDGSKNLVHRLWTGSSWSSWENLGGILNSGPAVAGSGPNDIHVFALDTSNRLVQTFWDGKKWSSWENLGGSLTSDPAAVSWQAGRYDVFARGTDNKLWHKWWYGGWSGWESLGGNLTSAPSAASRGPNRLDIFARGTDNAMWHKWYDGSSWQDWESLGGSLTSDPDSVSWR